MINIYNRSDPLAIVLRRAHLRSHHHITLISAPWLRLILLVNTCDGLTDFDCKEFTKLPTSLFLSQEHSMTVIAIRT